MYVICTDAFVAFMYLLCCQFLHFCVFIAANFYIYVSVKLPILRLCVFSVAYFYIYVSGIEAPGVQGGETLAVVVPHLFHLSELHGVDRWKMALYI